MPNNCDRQLSNYEIVSMHTFLEYHGEIITKREQGNGFYALCDILKDNNNSILDTKIDWELLSSCIAKLGNIRISNEYKDKGITREFMLNAQDVLKRNHFQSIELNAMWDGLVVWSMLYFDYTDNDKFEDLKDLVCAYLVSVHGYDYKKAENRVEKIKNLREIKAILKPSNKQFFTEWIKNKDKSLSIKMFKELS